MGDIQTNAQQIILGGAVFGAVIGIIPLLLGILKRKTLLGLGGLILSTIGGAAAGIFLAIPAVILFVWLILRNTTAAKNQADDIDRS
jgi:hypothetical protein